VLFVLLTFFATASLAAVDMFLDIPEAPGESEDDVHTGEIDVLAWSWGASTSNPGTGRRVGCNIQDVSVTKWVDAASPVLLMAQLQRTVFPEATLTVRKVGGAAGPSGLEYIVIVFYDVQVTSLSTGGSGGEDRLTENVSFSFSEAIYRYKPDPIDGPTDTIDATIGGC
jgi:type VI secretion system secreted protein Hcp